jgi:hypothetical protein
MMLDLSVDPQHVPAMSRRVAQITDVTHRLAQAALRANATASSMSFGVERVRIHLARQQ